MQSSAAACGLPSRRPIIVPVATTLASLSTDRIPHFHSFQMAAITDLLTQGVPLEDV
jgi:hypothetical protein